MNLVKAYQGLVPAPHKALALPLFTELPRRRLFSETQFATNSVLGNAQRTNVTRSLHQPYKGLTKRAIIKKKS
jgi:hypothetical protein